MSIVKTRITEPKNNNRFRVTVSFEHGDADLTTYNTNQFQAWSDQQLVEWVAKFRQYAQDINNMRWYSAEFDREACEAVLGIECESDKIYDNAGYDYVASMSIDKIEWVDNEGIVYKVTGY